MKLGESVLIAVIGFLLLFNVWLLLTINAVVANNMDACRALQHLQGLHGDQQIECPTHRQIVRGS